MPLIDVHTHFVPSEFPGAPDTEARWPSMCHRVGGTAEVMIDGKAFRRIDSRSWAAERRIADMEEADVTRQVLSPMPELLSYWFDSAAGLAMCRHMNESSLVASRPPVSCPPTITLKPMGKPAK